MPWFDLLKTSKQSSQPSKKTFKTKTLKYDIYKEHAKSLNNTFIFY